MVGGETHSAALDLSTKGRNVASSLAMRLNVELPYDVFKDLTPVSLIASVHNVLVVKPDSRATSAKELIALAKAKPGALSYSTPGVSSQGHIAAEMFNSMFGMNTLHVPYNSMGAAVKDVLGGEEYELVVSAASTMTSLSPARWLRRGRGTATGCVSGHRCGRGRRTCLEHRASVQPPALRGGTRRRIARR